MAVETEQKQEQKKKLPLNGCKPRFRAFTVLMKAGTHGLYVMRELDLEITRDDKIICHGIKDTVEDMFDAQLGKVEHGIIDGTIR